jgi:DNA-binding CsgD family transcriptional regulator
MKAPQLESWPSGGSWIICTLALTARELAERYEIEFRSELDNLGEVLEAVFSDPNVGQVALWWHDHPQFRSTEVAVDTRTSRDEGLAALWLRFGLDIRSMDWVNSYAEFPGHVATDIVRPLSPVPEILKRVGHLSTRETVVVRLLSSGKATNEIAKELRIAPSTVSGHLQRIYLKLGVHSRAELRELLRRQPNIARSA